MPKFKGKDKCYQKLLKWFFHVSFFTMIYFEVLCVIHFLYSKNKKVNVLGKVKAHADDKLGYFFKWPNPDVVSLFLGQDNLNN